MSEERMEKAQVLGGRDGREVTEEVTLISRQALSGALAGATTALVLHPLDTVKTFRQTDPALYAGILPTLRLVAEKRGVAALYSGLVPAILGSAPSSAVYFCTYEFARRHLTRWNETSRKPKLSRIALNMMSAASGNIVSSCIFLPKEILKQRLQVGLGGSVAEAAVIVFRESGIRGFYTGYFSTLLRNIPSTATKFVAYEEIKQFIKSFTGQDELSTAQHFAAGAASGVCSSLLTTPMDVLKTKFATGQGKGLNVLQLAGRIVQTDGVGGLYVGLRFRLVGSALFASIGFAAYEFFKRLLLDDQSRWIVRRPLSPPPTRISSRAAFQGGKGPLCSRYRTGRPPVLLA